MQGLIGFTGTLSGQIDDSGSGGTSNYNELTNKPSINSVPLVGNKTTEDLHLFSGDYDDLSDKPSVNGITLSGNKTTADLGLFSGNYNDLTNKPTLFSGDYNDLTNKPTIPEIDMNPSGAATEEMNDIEVDGTVYEVVDATARVIIGDGQLDPDFTATNLTGAANELKSNLDELASYLSNSDTVSVQAATVTDIASISLTKGSWLVLTFLSGNADNSGMCVNTLTIGGNSRQTRGTLTGGGGLVNYSITTVSTTTTAKVKAYMPVACNATGVINAIKLG